MLSIIFIVIFFAIVFAINAKNFGVKSFEEYATARGSFGMLAISLAVFSTWYVGATFTAFAGYSVGYGFIGLYVLTYATLTMLSMYLVAEKTYIWGKKYHIGTQAELMDLRYKSSMVRLVVGIAGIIFTAPWLLMEWITQGVIVLATVDVGALINVALLSYQGIIMIFPVVILGLYWKRANKEGALIGMVMGTIVSMVLTIIEPAFITDLGWSAGVYGLITTTIFMIIAGYTKPVEAHVEHLWKDIEIARGNKKTVPINPGEISPSMVNAGLKNK